jgi:succinate dehydrogenase hydrophobic anchor subunit
MIYFKKIFSLLLFFAFSITVWGQNGTQTVQMADTMRSNGRIFVVVAVMLTILIGLILYIVRLDRKISKIEKEIK